MSTKTNSTNFVESLFENPVLITEVVPQKSQWPERLLFLPPINQPSDSFGPEYNSWFERYQNFSVHVSNFPKAEILRKQIWNAFLKKELNKAESLFKELELLKVIPLEKRTNQEKWSHMMVQLPGDIGGPNKDKIRDLLSKECQGHILEAMCGFNSYLIPSFEREVVALDYCREALERYQYPERTRILFDLNKGRMNFFDEETFDVIVICFGFQYLSHPDEVFQEFYRILKRDGKLYLIENPKQHYEDIACRSFSTKTCASFLKQASFKKIHTQELLIAENWELKNGGHYYLVKANKS